MQKFRKGFTLAEVLITLGIIGIVAALTIPTLIEKAQKAALKSQFAKANALITTVINQIVYEKGITDLQKEYCYENNPACKSGDYVGLSTTQKLATDIIPYTKYSATKTSPDDQTKNPIDTRPQICNIDGTVCTKTSTYTNAGEEGQIPYKPTIFLQDGSIINIAAPENAYPQIIFDINGNQGPNKFGYDIFWWSLKGTKAEPTASNYGEGQDCQLSATIYSGLTCAQYAIMDICPWDNTKGYWEGLP